MSQHVEYLCRRLPILRSCQTSLEAAIEMVAGSMRGGGKLLVCGNGGSAADSEHLVADLMKGFMRKRPIPEADRDRLRGIDRVGVADISSLLQGALPAIALVSQGALMTALANDIRFDMVFAQQVYGLGRAGDVLFAISTTGNSPNVVNAAHVARSLGVGVVALTGRDGGAAARLADVSIQVPADVVFEVQELQLPVYHALALALEDLFFAHPGADTAAAQPADSHSTP
jgi:D-sedoheptulose 7-phosphate isomerase